jgi:hypothetical protein
MDHGLLSFCHVFVVLVHGAGGVGVWLKGVMLLGWWWLWFLVVFGVFLV